MRVFLSIAALFLCQPASADTDDFIAMVERGAVLCSYSITATLEKYARECAQDTKAQVWLYDLLEQHRDFVRRNAKVTDSDLDRFETEQSSPPPEYKLCEISDIDEMFQAVLANEQNFRSEIEESLSFDRRPVWNPCL